MAIVGIVCDTIIMGYNILFNILHISIRIAVIKPNIIPQTSPQKASVSVVPVCPKSSKNQFLKHLLLLLATATYIQVLFPKQKQPAISLKRQ